MATSSNRTQTPSLTSASVNQHRDGQAVTADRVAPPLATQPPATAGKPSRRDMCSNCWTEHGHYGQPRCAGIAHCGCHDANPQGAAEPECPAAVEHEPHADRVGHPGRLLPGGLALLITPVGEAVVTFPAGRPSDAELAKALADLVTLAEGSFDPAGHPYGEGAFKEHRYITAARSVLCRLTGKRQ